MVAEGERTTHTVRRVVEREGLYMPITAALAGVPDGELDVHQALAGLMEHPARAEVDADRVALR
jgi:glycerol-3-phosphate dehydrogenase